MSYLDQLRYFNISPSFNPGESGPLLEPPKLNRFRSGMSKSTTVVPSATMPTTPITVLSLWSSGPITSTQGTGLPLEPDKSLIPILGVPSTSRSQGTTGKA
uniref:Uncharacterized protein n=1 Tax=Steinernema glaseri TaxID=37863 RepID=A0A1I7YPR2_9BILA